MVYGYRKESRLWDGFSWMIMGWLVGPGLWIASPKTFETWDDWFPEKRLALTRVEEISRSNHG